MEMNNLGTFTDKNTVQTRNLRFFLPFRHSVHQAQKPQTTAAM